MNTFYGKYRGTVLDPDDPRREGRVKVSCPAVLGRNESWAMPCVPFAGDQMGLVLLPPKGANVWVEFEGGDPSHPIWTGCFWGPRQLPRDAAPDVRLLQCKGATLRIEERRGQGKLTLELASPLVSAPVRLEFSKAGAVLEHAGARIELDQTTVSVNGGALEVT